MAKNVIFFLVILLTCFAMAQSPALPEGKGKTELTNNCDNCHGLETVTHARNTKGGWKQVVEDMFGRGGSGNESDAEVIITYLAANFGKPINVNQAASKALQDAFLIPASEADAIVKYRQESGAFKTITDLLKVPGISAQKIREMEYNLVF